jgi:hypothetical protein
LLEPKILLSYVEIITDDLLLGLSFLDSFGQEHYCWAYRKKLPIQVLPEKHFVPVDSKQSEKVGMLKDWKVIWFQSYKLEEAFGGAFGEIGTVRD